MKWIWTKTTEQLPAFNCLLVGKWVDDRDDEFESYGLCYYVNYPTDPPPFWEGYETDEPLRDPPTEWTILNGIDEEAGDETTLDV